MRVPQNDRHGKETGKSTPQLAIMTMLAVLLLMMSTPAEAQLYDCPGIQTEGYKVFLDELSYSQDVFRTDKDLKIFMERLSWKLQTKIESLLTETRTIKSKIVHCPNRRPVDGSEFNKGIVDALNSRDVVLEVWGTLDATMEGNRIRNREARIRYVVIPVRFYSDMDGIYLVSYFGQSSGPPSDFIDMLDQAAEFEALLAVGIGVKSLKARNYDLSLQCLRTAKLKLEGIARKRSGLAASHRELINYIQNVINECISTAKADTEYRGAIKLIGGQ